MSSVSLLPPHGEAPFKFEFQECPSSALQFTPPRMASPPLAFPIPLSSPINLRPCRPMELRAARRPSPLKRPSISRSSSRLGACRRAASRYICHCKQMQDDLNIALRLGLQSRASRSPIMSLRNGDTTITCTGLCKVLWSIEADVAEGHLLFLTGDPVSLGCWELEMAVSLPPSKEQANLWKTEIKVPCGMNFKYNYFVKDEKQPSSELIWRPGPEFSLSIPSISRENEVLVVRDSWMRTRIERMPVPSWGSWMIDLPKNYIKHETHRASTSGRHKILRSPNGVPVQGKQLLVNFTAKDIFNSVKKDVEINARNSEEESSERDQPVEEPWLLRSTLISLVVPSELDERSNPDEVRDKELFGKLDNYTEILAPEEEHEPPHSDEPASTVILINSSVCTMQRIAVLEDGKFVELLLEPVKNNVQCDSVYLGVVTKLVPHMGGAFVDIGISRPSLMDIKTSREPFIYPPYNHQIKGEAVSGTFEVVLKEQFDIHEHDQSAYDEDDIIDELSEGDNHDDAVEIMQEEFEVQEAEEDADVSSFVKINGNIGSIDRGEADLEELFEGDGHHIEDESIDDFLPLEEETLVESDLSQLLQEELQSDTPDNKWSHVRKGTKVIVQVVKEGLGTKGPALSAYPNLRSRFWILTTRCDGIGVSRKISGVERTRLRVIAKRLQPRGFGLTIRTVAAGHSFEELQKDLEGILSTWKSIVEHAKSAALAAEEGVEGAVPVMLHRAMGQTLTIVQDYFNQRVNSLVVDSPRTYHEVINYLQEIAPDLCNRVELYDKRTPIFDEYGIEEEINNILSKRVPLSNGGSLVIEQTEALVSIDVNGGHGMLRHGTSQEKAVLDVNLAAAKQIARELRLRDIGGIIVVDFIDMVDEANRRLVYEEMKKAVERDRSMVRVSELSKHGLMEITRKRVRPSVTFMISEPCTSCHATGRVEALETSFSKIENEICRLLAALDQKPNPENAKSWPRFVLKVDRHMCHYLTSGKRTKLAVLSSSLKVWILLKVARGFSRGQFEVKPFTDDKAHDGQQVAISRLRPTEARTCFPSTKLTLFPIKKWKNRGKLK